MPTADKRIPLGTSRRYSPRSGDLIAIVDAGPLYASIDRGDDEHHRSAELLQRTEIQLVIPALVVGEVSFMLGRRVGPKAEAGFVRGLVALDVEAPSPDDYERMADLVEQYADFPLGAADASVIALAERLGTDVVVTLDRRHFGAVRPRHCAALRLLPD